MDMVEIVNLRKTGAEAMRRGDARAARESFQRLADAGQADVNIWIALAASHGRLEDIPAAHAAADRALALEARNLRALIVKGDLHAKQGDVRSASAFYMTALQAAPPLSELTADLRADLERANAMCQQHSQQFEQELARELGAAGFGGRASSPRFAQSLDLLFGRKQIFFQQPRYYFFPELPQIQFFDRASLPWLDRVEAATAEIREELLSILEDTAAFKPYVERDPRHPADQDNRMAGNAEWSAFYLVKNGTPTAENVARCPKTMAALADVPFPRIPNRSPSILFSLMQPGGHIPPHNGFINTRMICHLPLIVPGGCYFRVGNEEREWVEGKAWAFDDTMQHEAWNRSNRTRVVLLFEAWRPELTEEERGFVTAMFKAIDLHGGDLSDWGI